MSSHFSLQVQECLLSGVDSSSFSCFIPLDSFSCELSRYNTFQPLFGTLCRLFGKSVSVSVNYVVFFFYFVSCMRAMQCFLQTEAVPCFVPSPITASVTTRWTQSRSAQSVSSWLNQSHTPNAPRSCAFFCARLV